MSSPVRQHPAFDRLASTFSGSLVAPDDGSYEETRALHNAMIVKQPALIAQCANPADVAAAIAFAREAQLDLAIRAGGHSVAGMSLVDGGVVVDVRPMKEIRIDADRRVARVGAGCTWGEFDRAAQEHGLATTGGRVSTTGVAGFTLGGGSGWIERKYGLACDSLRAVDLVLADGRLVTASAEEHPDLFWALHGGGGNFGVATTFEFALHPVGPIVLAGLLLWPAASGPEVAHLYRDLAEGAPEELGSGLAGITGPPEDFVPPHLQGQPVCGVAMCWHGTIDEGQAFISPLRGLGPEVDLVQPMPYADFQCMLDDAPGNRNYWGAAFLAGLPDDAIATYLKASSAMPPPISQNFMLPWGGAVGRVSAAETPMAQRDARWVYHPFGVWESPADDEVNIAWARDSISAMDQFTTGGTYLNFIGDEGPDRIRAAFGDSYDRLADVKSQYDPDNVLQSNQNIVPAR